jgi:hypothetical protein
VKRSRIRDKQQQREPDDDADVHRQRRVEAVGGSMLTAATLISDP